MKMNWIKGLDRVAVLTAVPIAIFFGIYKSTEYTNNNRLWSFRPELTTSNYILTPSVNDFPIEYVKQWGASDSEIIEYLNISNNSRVPRIEEGLKKGFRLRDLKIVSPAILERIVVGLLWALGGGIIFFFLVSISTRGIPKTIRWLQNGFRKEEHVSNKANKRRS